MKKLLILAVMAVALTAGSMTVSAAPTGRGAGFCRTALAACEEAAENALTCLNRRRQVESGFAASECPNGGVPALDGTGYRGGRNDADTGFAASECPNGGVPALDGTGYRGGRNDAGTGFAASECPNGGMPALDGTGYRGGRSR